MPGGDGGGARARVGPAVFAPWLGCSGITSRFLGPRDRVIPRDADANPTVAAGAVLARSVALGSSHGLRIGACDTTGALVTGTIDDDDAGVGGRYAWATTEERAS